MEISYFSFLCQLKVLGHFAKNWFGKKIPVAVKSKNAASLSKVLIYYVGALKGIFDLPYCQNKHYECFKYRPNIQM